MRRTARCIRILIYDGQEDKSNKDLHMWDKNSFKEDGARSQAGDGNLISRQEVLG